MSFEGFLGLLRDTYDKPQDMARWVMAQGITRGQALLALALVAVVTTLLAVGAGALGQVMRPSDPTLANLPQDPLVGLLSTPFALAVMQLAGMLFGAVMIHRVGRMFGGKGTWDQTLPLVAWLQIVFMVLQVAQLLLVLALPMLALPVLLFTVFSVFFLTAQFIAALHGFTSVGKVLGGMIATLILVSFGLAILFVLIFGVQHV